MITCLATFWYFLVYHLVTLFVRNNYLMNVPLYVLGTMITS